MRQTTKLLGLCAGAIFTLVPLASAQNLLGVDTFGTSLAEIDTAIPMVVATTPLTLAGQTVVRANGLSRNPETGVLYAILQLAVQTGRELVTVDEFTGVCTSVGDTGDKFANLTFTRDGTLYGVTGDGAAVPETLYTLSLVDGSATLVLALGNGDDGEAIAYNPNDGRIYHASGLGVQNDLINGEVFEPINIGGVPSVGPQIMLSGVDASEVRGMVDNGRYGFYATEGSNLYEYTTAGVITDLGSIIGATGSTRGFAYVRPSNDDCSTATVIGDGAFTGTLLGATNDGNSTCGFGMDTSPDVWFSYTASAYGMLTVDTAGTHDMFGTDTGVDTVLSVHSGCPGDTGNILACADDTTFGAQMGFIRDSQVMLLVNAGETVLIRVANYNAGGSGGSMVHTGAFNLNTSLTTLPPPNDDCANATVLSPAFGVTMYDGTMATTDGMDTAGFCDHGSPGGDDQNHNDIWFTYTPAVGGCTYISTFGLTSVDTKLTIYASAGCPDDPATAIACVDDEVQPISSPFEAGLDIDLTAGQTYMIRLGTYAAFVQNGLGSLQILAGPGADINSGGNNPGAPGCDAFLSFCNGDGGNGGGCTDCPCNNNASNGTIGGCLNSAGTSARLIGSGDTSVSLMSNITTDLRFALSGAPPLAFCILNSGDALAPGNAINPCFGLNTGAQAAAFDGLRCAITNTRRHGGRSADANGDVGVTNNPWGGEGGPPAGIAQAGFGFMSGQTRFFQAVNRDVVDMVCPIGRGLNTSQAQKVTFTP